jgi:hypothetical protein
LHCDKTALPLAALGPHTVVDGYTPPEPTMPPLDRAAAAMDIDDAVATVYGRFTRFAIEYEEREAQAQAFKVGGYAGAPPPRVAEFATPAGKSGQEAADLILAQAAQLRDAQGQLSALRMRKYEVLRAATDAEAREALDAILAGVRAIGKALA